MIKEEFDAMIDDILSHGITIELSKEDDIRWYNLQTGMKSHLHIAYVDGKCIYRGRYDASGELEDLRELLYRVSRCMYGRDFGNDSWLDWLCSEGILEKTVTTTVSYK